MTKVTQEQVDNVLRSFCQQNLEDHYYRFIPCIEYSKEFWPGERYYDSGYYRIDTARWSYGRYYMNERYSYNSRTVADPMKNFITMIDNQIRSIEEGCVQDKLVYSDVPNDVFLEFDFKHKYNDENQRKMLFGERTESEAYQFYIDSVKRNTFLLSEMKLVSSRKIGDIARVCDAYDELFNTNSLSTLVAYVMDFKPWLGQYGESNHYANISNNIDKNKLKITDFYTIVPDNATPEDLVKAYYANRPIIDTDKPKRGMLYNKNINDGADNRNLSMHVYLVAVLTKSDLEDMFAKHIKWLYSSNYVGVDTFKSQLTIENSIKRYQEYAKEASKTSGNAQYYYNRWPDQLAGNLDFKHLVIKIEPNYNDGYTTWSANKITLCPLK